MKRKPRPKAKKAKAQQPHAPNYHFFYAIFGLMFGFTLARIGFGDYNEVHKMWALIDLRMLYAFGGGVAVAMLGFTLFTIGQSLPQKKIHPGTIFGGILFGGGWVLSGACPSTALVQIGAGYLPGVFTVIGILIGAWMYRIVHARFFRWDTGACDA